MDVDELVSRMRECAACGAGYSDTRGGARGHLIVFGHRPRPVPEPTPSTTTEEGPTDDR